MALKHGTILDTDPHFIINPITRQLSTTSSKITLIQGDHRSERFTFEISKEVEGHDMALTDKVAIHYINIDQLTKAQSTGIWEADDVVVVPADETNPARVSFSWLIESPATKYQGSLHFVVRFKCTDGDVILYSWGTAIYTGIAVGSGIDNGEAFVEDYSDILAKWEQELKANQVVKMEQTTVATTDEGENVWTATFGDGRTSELKVKNGSRGPTGYLGSILTVDGKVLQFYAGSQEGYDELTPAQKVNLFAIIDNSPVESELLENVASFAEWKAGVEAGTTVVPEAEKATKDANGDVISDTYQAKLKNDEQYQAVCNYGSFTVDINNIYGKGCRAILFSLVDAANNDRDSVIMDIVVDASNQHLRNSSVGIWRGNGTNGMLWCVEMNVENGVCEIKKVVMGADGTWGTAAVLSGFTIYYKPIY